jgi:lysyl-tRNA synthetase class 2
MPQPDQPQHNPPEAPAQDENHIIAERRAKLAELRQLGPAYPNDFARENTAGKINEFYDGKRSEELAETPVEVRVAGRIMLKRVMGKASFVTLQDLSGRIQAYVSRDDIGEEAYSAFRRWDMGDIIGVVGTLFRTRTGELTIRSTAIRLLTKSLRPLPEKFHGLTDQEQKYRMRYVDLITSEQSGFLEVETPMMQPIPGGARHGPSSRTTTRSTWICSCASRPSSTSSAWSSAASSASSRSTATSATRASVRATTPSSRCWSSTRPTRTTAT